MENNIANINMHNIPKHEWMKRWLASCIAVTSIFDYKLSVLSLTIFRLNYKVNNEITTCVLANKEPRS